MTENFDFTQTVMSSDSAKSRKFLQHAAACTANLSAFALGNTLAWSSPATPLLLRGNAGFPVNEHENSVVSSLLTVGAAVSCLPAGYVADTIGRKRTMLSLVPLYLFGWGLIIWAQNIEMLLSGRFILGICAGIVCVTTPVFTAEICQKEIRGALGIYYQLMLSGGILFTYIVGSQLNVFWLSFVCALAPIVFGVAFIFFPETPVYFLTKGEPEKARKSLQFFRGPHYDLEPELCELTQYSDKGDLGEESTLDVFLSKQGIKSLTMCIGLMIFQQLSGVNAIIFYTTTIFEDSGSSIEPKYSTVITGVVSFVTTFFVVFVVDRIGRVILLGTSALLMSLSTLILGVYFYLKESDHHVEHFSWLPLVSLCLFLIVFSVGYGPVPWSLMPEIIPSKIKATSSSIACVINWISAFLVTKFFPDLKSTFGTGVTFLIFAAVSALGTLFSFKMLPETKGKSFEEIQRKLGGED